MPEFICAFAESTLLLLQRIVFEFLGKREKRVGGRLARTEQTVVSFSRRQLFPLEWAIVAEYVL